MSSRPTRTRRTVRALLLGLVLALTALVVPNSTVASTEAALVRFEHSRGVDLDPDLVWILAVGSDARPGENMLRVRGDALQLVGINTRTGAATAIGIPRDSYVAIPGHGRNKINASMVFGGPRLMAASVARLVGVRPDYVFTTGFLGFRAMVRAMGGVTVNSKFSFGNQQELLRSILRKARAHQSQPGFMERGLLATVRNTNTNLRPSELFRLAQAVTTVRPAKLRGCVLGGSTGSAGGASVVFVDAGQARRLGNDARRDGTLDRGC
jgi:LCP family protein required for cell wall assembly